jgi:hypothetical protein
MIKRTATRRPRGLDKLLETWIDHQKEKLRHQQRINPEVLQVIADDLELASMEIRDIAEKVLKGGKDDLQVRRQRMIG